MATIQSPRGTRDILPADQAAWNFVRSHALQVAEQMGYQPITIPTYEELTLFERAIGQGTDIQDKELFLVQGKHTEESAKYALRPEATAGIVRSFIEHGMHTWPQPVKLYTFSNNFRYDRPQKGRYREHVQFDIEYFGDKGPFADAWIIYTMWRFYHALGLSGVRLSLNTLGTAEERAAYIAELVAFCTANQEKLSQDSRRRIQTNPLRILDSKEREDAFVRSEGPSLRDFLGEQSKHHYQAVKEYLGAWNIPLQEDPYLVRGLDYYSHTTFEWVMDGNAGQQGSIGGGGRYDGLIPQLGGPDVGAVGAGIGLDRVIEEVIHQGTTLPGLAVPDIYLCIADQAGKDQAPTIINQLLSAGLRVNCDLSKESLGSQMKAASKQQARYAAVLGEAEASAGNLMLKRLSDGHQEHIALQEVAAFVSNGHA